MLSMANLRAKHITYRLMSDLGRSGINVSTGLWLEPTAQVNLMANLLLPGPQIMPLMVVLHVCSVPC